MGEVGPLQGQEEVAVEPHLGAGSWGVREGEGGGWRGEGGEGERECECVHLMGVQH